MTAILRTQQRQKNTNMKLIRIWIHKAGNHTYTHEQQKNLRWTKRTNMTVFNFNSTTSSENI